FDRKTSLVVRYHDAFAVFMPSLFANKSRHQATHFNALKSNIDSGAYFACVSNATREDLLRLFPEVRERAITIYNMVSHHFFDEESAVSRVTQIIRTRLDLITPEAHPEFSGVCEQEEFYKDYLSEHSFQYLLMVSTIEPRKNHERLIAAWEIYRAEVDPSMKLVIVGSLGWNVEPIMQKFRPWVDQGAVFILNNVPADDLRILYCHAAATVCPSLAEGFDFSGVEAMRSGGVVIASDIPVHREIYNNAAEYFDPYCTVSLVEAIRKVLFNQNASQVQEKLRALGKEMSARYLPENILPQWERFLQNVKQMSAKQLDHMDMTGSNT
ncbi:MAG TPA: glycosyltransferase family 1 protein, partial [Gammaproteobacteria bacterium]|nr:glycosyltransferase family 1 protein [Gammaproteobacteria bacterium]